MAWSRDRNGLFRGVSHRGEHKGRAWERPPRAAPEHWRPLAPETQICGHELYACTQVNANCNAHLHVRVFYLVEWAPQTHVPIGQRDSIAYEFCWPPSSSLFQTFWICPVSTVGRILRPRSKTPGLCWIGNARSRDLKHDSAHRKVHPRKQRCLILRAHDSV